MQFLWIGPDHKDLVPKQEVLKVINNTFSHNKLELFQIVNKQIKWIINKEYSLEVTVDPRWAMV